MWLSEHATRFEAECDACRAGRFTPRDELGRVEGSLRPDADLGFATCRRGHRLVLRRIVRVSRLASVS